MKKYKMIPKRRFKEFENDGAWEQRKLSELTSLITKGTTPLDKSGNGNINFIKIENIDPSSNKIISTAKITMEEHDGYLKRSQLQENDILFSIAGTLGRVTTVNREVLPANTNQALAIIRLKSGYLRYITTYLKGKAVSEYIKKNPTIGAQPNLSLEQVGNLEISFPKNEEQIQIGDLFQHLDNLITLHQRKLEAIKNLKKAMLQKMFPEKGEKYLRLRFAGFTDDWEQRKLKELGEIITGSTPKTNDATNYGGKSLFVSPADIQGNRYVEKTITTLSRKGFNTGRHIREGASLFVSIGSTIGKVAQTVKKSISNQQINALVSNEHYDDDFVFTLLETHSVKIKAIASNQAVPIVNKTTFGETEVMVPNTKKEQEQIGTFFKNLDNLITLHQRKLENLENLKKALLQRMFV